ncbi:MarR family winged helix-turn-helix transcriptional regulator [Chitinophaga solisilvae]|uniref:Winged helix-turn-helix transcriptional regulator n=1 Tax=Chitinophaga solisilvae TaxID=1233460 RepID=A0A433WFY2_9BACT|nr:MarR family winged helix-turn-helix transcriptional regulator [Chitinophaga solisilvae]NSL90130.1 winged helix-turn-helix transcriptional regulator [Chitinophaga solisilvae]
MSSTTDARYEASLALRPNSLARYLSLIKKDADSRLTDKLQERGYVNFRLSDMVLLVNIDPYGTINNELAKKARISKQAMSKIVKSLIAEGFIGTRKHDTDNRASIIFITEKGKELMINASEAVEELTAFYTAVIGQDDMQQLKQILGRLLEGLENL